MKTQKFLPPLVILIISGALLVIGLNAPDGAQDAYSYPNAVVLAMALLSVIWLAAEFKTGEVVGVQGVQWRATVISILVMVVYLALIRFAGLLVASAITYFGTALLFQDGRVSGRSLVTSAVSTAAFILIIYLLFNRLLQLQSPGGYLNLY